MSVHTFPHHGQMILEHAIRIEVKGDAVTYYAGDRSRKVWIDNWPDGLIVQEQRGSSGAIVIDGRSTMLQAFQWALLFISCAGGEITIHDTNNAKAE